MPAHAALEAFLSAQLEPLRGRFREVNIRLTPPEGIEVVPGEALLDPTTLRETIARFGERIGTNNQRIAGVHWLGQLGYAVLPPIEIAMTRAGVGLDAGLANLGIVQPSGQPADILIRDLSGTVVLPERYTGDLPLDTVGRVVASADELRAFVLDGLFGRTFLPLIERIHELTGVSPQVLWGQVAYEADLFYGQLQRAAPDMLAPAWAEDRETLFDRRWWSVNPDENPLDRPTRQVTMPDKAGGAPTIRVLRSKCCLIYQVPTGKMCGACPLALKKEVVVEKRATAPERRAAHAS